MNYAEIFRALADENRLLILEALTDGEKCANELLSGLNISQPTLSHHMKILTDSGIVLKKKHGQKTFYIVSADAADAMSEYFSSLKKPGIAFSNNTKKSPAARKKQASELPKREEQKQTDIWLF